MTVVVWTLLNLVNSDDAVMAIELDPSSRSIVLITESALDALVFMQ